MCIAYLRLGEPQWPLLIAANRDEFHHRPTAPLAPWPGASGMLAGRDLLAGGTWLGWASSGRFALLTNYREPGATVAADAPSRGSLVQGFLQSQLTAEKYLQELAQSMHLWAGFNLIAGYADGRAWYLSNRMSSHIPVYLQPGVYVLSNHLLDTPWPKSERLRAHLNDLAPARWAAQPELVLSILRDTQQAADPDLPTTGLNLQLERLLSSPFIISADYGTRSSSVIALDHECNGIFCEQSYASSGIVTQRHDWRLQAKL